VGGDGTILAGKSFSSILPYSLAGNDLMFAGSPLVVTNGYALVAGESATGVKMYSGWITSSNAENSNLFSPSTNVSYVTQYACPAGFPTNTYIGDSYALPLLLDLPMSVIEKAEDVEVRLIQKEFSFKSIMITTQHNDDSTKKRYPWVIPEEESK
jgi:hypothetical protein